MMWTRVAFWVGVLLVTDGLVALALRRRLSRLLPRLDIPILALVEIIAGLALLIWSQQ